MIIVNKDKNIIINANNIECVGMSDDKREIKATGRFTHYILGRYEDEEVTETVFNQITEAMEQCEKIFYMPE